MDEEVGDVDVAGRALEAVRIGDVADVKLTSSALQAGGSGGVADEATDGDSVLAQPPRQTAADEPRRTRDQCELGDAMFLPGKRRL